MYKAKAEEAVYSVFDTRNDVRLECVKSAAKRLCSSMNLDKLVKSIDKAEKVSLDLFFAAKTHKVDCPLRVIVSENGTWQKSLARFLQQNLNSLTVDDPFKVKNSDEVIRFLKDTPKANLSAFSVDIKDLYYSIPQDSLLTSVRNCIDRHGVIPFQNSSGLSVDNFLELLSTYLKSTFAVWEGTIVTQKNGICIGSCVAPVLSDIFLAERDRELKRRSEGSSVVGIFRYVDDFLVFTGTEDMSNQANMSSVLSLFSECLQPLILTHELAVNRFIRFLDLGIYFSANHVCWAYEPRGNKPVLPFGSAHSKLVKRAIVKSCFCSALEKSCEHRLESAFLNQVTRLNSSGYPSTLLLAVAESLLKESREVVRNQDGADRDWRKNMTVLPYMHTIAHQLKKIGKRAGVHVIIYMTIIFKP
ncbi:uncharacterized protein LOC144127710 [Amblyomma americanum]